MPNSSYDISRCTGARLTIDLAAIVDNWQTLSDLHPNAEASAVVKANAYGLGVLPISEALYNAGCRTFFVATMEEAIELRQTVPDREIFILQGLLKGQESDFVKYGLAPCLNSLEQIQMWRMAAAPLGRPLPCAIHFDTGMSRLGLCAQETKILLDDWSKMEGLDLRMFMSHMACADTPEHPMNRQQQEAMNDLKSKLPPIRMCLAASSASLLGPEYGFDMIRPGIGLYGGILQQGLKSVVRIDSQILQIREIEKGTPVGYGASFTAQRKSRIATLDIGYADGYLRSLSNSGQVSFSPRISPEFPQTYQVPLIGRVSMDMLTADITDIPADQISVGDYMTVLGPERSAEKIASEAGTISYEILTSLGKRYQRQYI